MKLKSLHKIDTSLVLLFEDGEGCILSPFGKNCYSVVSDGILKSSIASYKEDALECNFNLLKLKKKYGLDK